jgi:hypothetical protein
MSMPAYRRDAPQWLQALVTASRQDLGLAELPWYVSQQRPTDHESVNSIDVTSELEKMADVDPHLTHLKAFDLPKLPQQLVIDAEGIIALGELHANAFLQSSDGKYEDPPKKAK